MVVNKEHHDCPVEDAIQILSGKWKILILWKLTDKPRRFAELKRLVAGITEKMLIQQLRELETDGVIYRKDYHQMPLKVEYSLTQQGQELKPIFDELWKWGSHSLRSN
ncbi:winged helix-turn-helix transcriptional regulator [Nostoc sp.]|uniref:winged helix-turn-helix transcriptional regulator n=1 Tax=Nostoc sp. TaxID=1180 RepID=UPI002FF96542